MTLRQAAIGALVVSLALGSVAGILFLFAFRFRLEWFTDPSAMVAAGPASAELLRWGAIADLFSYYLAMGVVAYAVWTALRPLGRALADLATSGLPGRVLRAVDRVVRLAAGAAQATDAAL
jgi:hypothetical protein